MPISKPVRYSFVIPIYNEEAVLSLLVDRMDAMLATLDGPAEAIFVNDGSKDASAAALEVLAQSRPHFRCINLSRNFGHQIAITAGMDLAQGDAIIVMDADLQDPPEIVGEMIERWKQGYEIVYARRLSRAGETLFKRATANLFYKLLGKLAKVDIPQNVGDFRLIDAKVLAAFKLMPERDRYVRGMFAWLGFRQTFVDFHRPERAAGESKYPFLKMIRLALNGLVSFSDAPLRLAIWAGIVVSLMAFAFGLYVMALWLGHSALVSGWSSTIIVISLLCGMNMLMTGILGLYIGRIYNEVKNRPLYVIDTPGHFPAKAVSAQDGQCT